jgi:hypothetical protein
MIRNALVVALSTALTISAAGPLSAQSAAPAPIVGTIVSATPSTVVLDTDQGQKSFKVASSTSVIMRVPATMADITKGEWLGVDAKKGAAGDLTAVSITILPNDFSGRKGQWMMESGDTMTNAQVTEAVSGVSGHAILMTYDGGTAKIAVPDSATIHRVTLSSLSALKPQMHATVRGTSNGDGTWTATSIVVDSSSAAH